VTPSPTDGFSLEVNYTREVVSQAEVNVILDHSEAALSFLAHHPHDPIGDVNLINENERQRLVWDVNSRALHERSRNH
jgi:hypothetical protein